MYQEMTACDRFWRAGNMVVRFLLDKLGGAVSLNVILR
jgi:hypothetical protein